MISGLAEMNTRFERRMADAGYAVKRWKLSATEHEGRVAENMYFAVAFQPFLNCDQMLDQAREAELELTTRMKRESSKVWDTYLLLASQESVSDSGQADQIVGLQYDTRHMRKLVAWNCGYRPDAMDDLVRPFLELARIQVRASTRDPLAALGDRLIARSVNPELVRRALSMYREGLPLGAL